MKTRMLNKKEETISNQDVMKVIQETRDALCEIEQKILGIQLDTFDEEFGGMELCDKLNEVFDISVDANARLRTLEDKLIE